MKTIITNLEGAWINSEVSEKNHPRYVKYRYSFIVLTHVKVKQMTLQFLYGNNTQNKTWIVSWSQVQDPQWAFKVYWCVTRIV